MQVEVLSAIDQFLASPAGVDYELLDGELYHMGSESVPHQLLLHFLEHALRVYVKAEALGQVFRNVRANLGHKDQPIPDLSFLASDKLDKVLHGSISTAPDVVFEVLSNSTQYKDLVINPRRYAKYGVKEYHLINPKTFGVKSWHSGLHGYGKPLEQQSIFISPVLGCRIEIGHELCHITKL